MIWETMKKEIIWKRDISNDNEEAEILSEYQMKENMPINNDIITTLLLYWQLASQYQ